MVIIDLVELPQRLGFSVEDLDRLRAREMLLKKRVDACDPGSHHVVTFTRTLTEPRRRGKQEWYGKQCHERQPYIHPQHHRDDCHDHYEVAEEVGHTLRKEFIECVYVSSEARHDATHRIPIVV